MCDPNPHYNEKKMPFLGSHYSLHNRVNTIGRTRVHIIILFFKIAEKTTSIAVHHVCAYINTSDVTERKTVQTELTRKIVKVMVSYVLIYTIHRYYKNVYTHYHIKIRVVFSQTQF